MLNNKQLNRRWLAGFYFNSAIQRIAASYDRIPKLLKAKGRYARDRMADANKGAYAVWDLVYEEVNAFKHDAAGRASGRTVMLQDSVAAFEELITFLKSVEAKLASIYS